jgi:hypothetical protein
MPEEKKISRTEVERIFQLEEGHYLDFKSVEIEPAKLSRSVSAFANMLFDLIFKLIKKGDWETADA